MAVRPSRTPRKKPAQKRSKETVRAILTAAAHILVRDGYLRANVNHIAEHAGVSIGSLYQYFPTKEALVAEVARQLTAEMTTAFEDGLADLPFRPMREAVHGVVRNSVRAFRVNPRLRQVIIEELPTTLFDTAELDRWIDDALRAYFTLHKERIRPQNIDLAVAILRSSVEAASRVTADRGDKEDEVVDELAHLVYAYLMR